MESIEEYRWWLIFQYNAALGGSHYFEQEKPDELAATRAEYHSEAFKEALTKFNRLFPQKDKA